MIQITMITFLASSVAFHLLYIANKNFNPAFSSMRILSLGAFIAMRLEVSGREEEMYQAALFPPLVVLSGGMYTLYPVVAFCA